MSKTILRFIQYGFLSVLGGVCLLLLTIPAAAQSRDTLRLKFQGRWDDDKLAIYGKQTFSSLWGWAAPDGKEYAIIGALDSIYFIEVTNPKKPVVRDAEATPYHRGTNREFKTYKNYCYAICDQGSSSLQIFDMRYLPDSVHKVYDTTNLVFRAHNLFVDGDRLYIADNKALTEDMEYYPMTVLSLADPERPTVLGHLDPPKINDNYIHAEVHDVYVRNDTAWCSVGNAGLFVYDYRDHTNPKLITSIQPPYPYNGYNHSGALSPDGRTFVFADENHFKPLKVYDASLVRKPNVPRMEYLTTIGFNSHKGSIAHNMFIKDTLLYVSWYHEGVLVYDISDPSNPVLAGHYDTYPQNDTVSEPGKRYEGYQGCWNVYPFLRSGNIIASDMSNGLYVLRMQRELVPDHRWKIKLLGNPVKDKIKLEIAAEEAHIIQVSLWDMAGRMIWDHVPQQIHPGVEELSYPFQKNPGNGMYLLRVQSEEGVEVLRVMCW